MSRSDFQRLTDICEHLERISRLTEGLEFAQFLENEAVYQAVLYSLGIVGEAVKAVGADIKSLDVSIEWSKMARLRDIVFHIYFGISDETLWNIIQSDVPQTLQKVGALRASQELE